TRDFYTLAAFFADLKETAVGVQEPTRMPTAEQEAEMKRLDEQMALLRQTLDRQTPELDAGLAAWETSLASQKSSWRPLRPTKAESQHGATLTVLDDGVVRVENSNPERDIYTLTVELESGGA